MHHSPHRDTRWQCFVVFDWHDITRQHSINQSAGESLSNNCQIPVFYIILYHLYACGALGIMFAGLSSIHQSHAWKRTISTTLRGTKMSTLTEIIGQRSRSLRSMLAKLMNAGNEKPLAGFVKFGTNLHLDLSVYIVHIVFWRSKVTANSHIVRLQYNGIFGQCERGETTTRSP